MGRCLVEGQPVAELVVHVCDGDAEGLDEQARRLALQALLAQVGGNIDLAILAVGIGVIGEVQPIAVIHYELAVSSVLVHVDVEGGVLALFRELPVVRVHPLRPAVLGQVVHTRIHLQLHLIVVALPRRVGCLLQVLAPHTQIEAGLFLALHHNVVPLIYIICIVGSWQDEDLTDGSHGLRLDLGVVKIGRRWDLVHGGNQLEPAQIPIVAVECAEDYLSEGGRKLRHRQFQHCRLCAIQVHSVLVSRLDLVYAGSRDLHCVGRRG